MQLNQTMNIFHTLNNLNFDLVIISAAILLILIISICIGVQKNRDRWYKQAPSLITTIGIFFTFIGITVGLLRFDPNDENSLNFLLSGLKLSFIPSALAIFIAIGFKWASIKFFSNNHAHQLSQYLEQNTNAIGKLIKAIEIVDWQVSYRDNLEQNVEYSTQLLAVLEASLINLTNTAANRKEQLESTSTTLETAITDCKNTLGKINSDLNITTERLNSKTKTLFDSIKAQEKTISEIADMYINFNSFNDAMNNLGSFAGEITQQLKQNIRDELNNIEQLITDRLRKTLKI